MVLPATISSLAGESQPFVICREYITDILFWKNRPATKNVHTWECWLPSHPRCRENLPSWGCQASIIHFLNWRPIWSVWPAICSSCEPLIHRGNNYRTVGEWWLRLPWMLDLNMMQKGLSVNLIHALELSWNINILLRCVAGILVLHAPSLTMMVS